MIGFAKTDSILLQAYDVGAVPGTAPTSEWCGYWGMIGFAKTDSILLQAYDVGAVPGTAPTSAWCGYWGG